MSDGTADLIRTMREAAVEHGRKADQLIKERRLSLVRYHLGQARELTLEALRLEQAAAGTLSSTDGGRDETA